MDIVIVGVGKVGFSLAEQLVRESHNVTLVDQREDTLRHAADTLDIMPVRGNGVSVCSLEEAGVDHADLLVAATNSDEVNMICCLTAKNLGTRFTIARIRNPEYTSSLTELCRNLKIDMVINPESATAAEIARLLRFPAAANIETFCRGRVELMGFRLQPQDFLVGKPLMNLSSQIKRLSLLFCAAERDGQVSIPNGSFVPQAGDKLYLVGRPDSLDQFFQVLGRYTPKIKRVFITGGGKISAYLLAALSNMGMNLKVVELNEARCRVLSETFPAVSVLHGDGTDQDLLDSERLAESDAFVALTDRDEDNLITALYASQLGLSKVIAKCNRQNYAGIVRSVGLDSVLSPKFITASYILHVVRGMQNSQGSVMNSLHRIADGGAEAMEFTVAPSTHYLGVPLRELKLKPGVLIAVIVRGREIIIPEGSSALQANDNVILISRSSVIRDLNDIFRAEAAPERGAGGAQ